MISVRNLITAALVAEFVSATAFTTIDPCPAAPKNITQLHQSCTVTAQHQPVSTCTRDSAQYGWSTYKWVSTVIPCWGEKSISSCTVTDTTQVVPCTGTTKTITSFVPTSTKKPNGTYETYNITKYETVSKVWIAPYNKIGPLAIPGYGGCELCTDCGPQSDGGKRQQLDVTECTSAAGNAPVCSKYADTWYSRAVPSTTGAVSAAISKHTAVPSAGVYTYYFPQPAPSTTIQSQNQWFTVPAKPWTATVTKTFSGPQDYDIIVTVTKTVTFNVPYSTESDPKKTPAPEGIPHKGWGAWNPDPKTTTTTAATKPGSWSDWASFVHSQESASSTTTQSARPWDPQGHKNGQQTSWGAWSKPGDATTTVTLTTLSIKVSSTTTVTTTLTTSSTTSAPAEETTSFYIEVSFTGLRKRYTKRDDASYLGFLDGADDASVVKASQGPAKFSFDINGYLRTTGLYIASDSSSGFFVFQRTTQRPTSPPPYALVGGVFTRSGPGSFCATADNFFISVSSAPSDCKPVTCKSNSDPNGSTTTSSSSSVTSTTKSSTTTYSTRSAYTTTTSQADVSADLAVPDPTPFVRRSARRM